MVKTRTMFSYTTCFGRKKKTGCAVFYVENSGLLVRAGPDSMPFNSVQSSIIMIYELLRRQKRSTHTDSTHIHKRT